jgi:ABC-type cobalamin/Fe3+-siderophores transport system ATPase subunit
MSSEYRGMRWFKCDLHVHTPEDGHHWEKDCSCRLPNPREEGGLQEKARFFLNRCHQLELDCIGVVDHNFSAERDSRKWFLTHLIEQNGTAAQNAGREPLVIFPGFELDIRYHLLCLFDPVANGQKLDFLSDILTGMGLRPDMRFADGAPRQPTHHGQCWSLREVLDEVQKEYGGMVIAGHAFSNDGICNDTANISDFESNPDLYAVEVNAWPPKQEKVRSILYGANGEWKRPEPHQPPAAVMGSDAKSLQDEASANTLGYRSTWIKMSSPGCESLRQAFLDSESRICLDGEPPTDAHTHIRRLNLNGNRFLEDQEIHLSPHLNCLIGGRGSGKSMLFEGLRLGLRGDVDIMGTDHVANKQIERLRGLLKQNARIELEVHHAGLSDLFAVDDSEQPARVEDRQVEDPPTVFRQLGALIFSQEEITQLAERHQTFLEFIDRLAGNQFEPNRQKAAEFIDQLKSSRQIEKRIQHQDEELISLRQEVAELARQLEAKTQIQEELKRQRAAQEAGRYLDSVSAKTDEVETRLKDLAEELETEPPPLDSRRQNFPSEDYFIQVEGELRQTYRELARKFCEATTAWRGSIDRTLTQNPRWLEVQESITAAEAAFKTACEEKGLSPEDAERLRETEQQHRTRQAALQAKQAERDSLKKQLPDKWALMRELAACWYEETEARRSLLNVILESDTMPRTRSNKPILEVTVTFAGNRKAFLEVWGKLAPDRRSRAGRAWDRYDPTAGRDNIGDQLFDAFHRAVQDSGEETLGNPVQWLEAHWDRADELPTLVRQYRDEIETVSEGKPEDWFELSVMRLPDEADLKLLRRNDEPAGSFMKNQLSLGQKNTAILSLLLSRGDGPVLIDQPEDQLDSEFLYHELVPMLRNAKNQRQLIIVTHNANIPVNADAELVYALDARDGRGVCRTQGGLDQADVTRAVLDIMEGSEEAFRRRKEKYHF